MIDLACRHASDAYEMSAAASLHFSRAEASQWQEVGRGGAAAPDGGGSELRSAESFGIHHAELVNAVGAVRIRAGKSIRVQAHARTVRLPQQCIRRGRGRSIGVVDDLHGLPGSSAV